MDIFGILEPSWLRGSRIGFRGGGERERRIGSERKRETEKKQKGVRNEQAEKMTGA